LDLKAWSELALNVIATLGSLGLFTALFLSIRWYWHRLRWRNFARRVDSWAALILVEPDDESLRLMTINWLTESGFSPVEATALLNTAAMFARARIDFAVFPDRYRRGEGP